MSGNLINRSTTDKIIKAFYYVYNRLGYRFLEKVYENALVMVLRQYGCKVAQQTPIKVYFEGELVGDYYADIIVNDCVIVELKTAESIAEAHEAQLINYLRATDIEVGLLLNFGTEPEFRRKVFSKTAKGNLRR
ncbi:GxxExxY protein [Candidatus Poribacteria bacterium]